MYDESKELAEKAYKEAVNQNKNTEVESSKSDSSESVISNDD